MSQKPETVFRAKFSKRLALVPNSWWESIQQKTIVGSPDKMGCVNGFFVALEFKATAHSTVTKLQEHKLKLISAAGGLGVVVHPDNADNVFDMLMHLAHKET